DNIHRLWPRGPTVKLRSTPSPRALRHHLPTLKSTRRIQCPRRAMSRTEVDRRASTKEPVLLVHKPRSPSQLGVYAVSSSWTAGGRARRSHFMAPLLSDHTSKGAGYRCSSECPAW